MRRLGAVLAALAVAAGAIVWWAGSADARVGAAVAEAPYVAYPTVEQVSDFGFMQAELRERRALGNNVVPVFGSSELYPNGKGEGHPMTLLRGRRYGVDAVTVGRAYCEDLWHAVEMGALAPDLVAAGENRVVFFVSLSWFMQDRHPAADLASSFSEGAYEAFMANDAVSDATKGRIAARLAEYGIDKGQGAGPLAEAASAVDGVAERVQKRVRLDVALEQAGGTGGLTDDEVSAAAEADGSGAGAASTGAAAAAQEPDWDTLFARGDAEAHQLAYNNDLGYDGNDWATGWRDRFLRWGSEIDPAKELLSSQEFDDLDLALEVCQEAGLKPLVVIQSCKGEAYDKTPITADVRVEFYQRVRDLSAAHGADVADFSPHEYDTYFCRDEVHPSALGSVYYSKAIWTWLMTGTADTSGLSAAGE